MRSAAIIVATVVVTLVTTTVVGHILSQLGVGPYWVHYHHADIQYSCMYESKEDWIAIQLDRGQYDVED